MKKKTDKTIGDVWYSSVAPEECHYWMIDRPWSPEKFRDHYETTIVSFNVKGTKTISPATKEKFSLREPLHLSDTGIDIVDGYTSTTTQILRTRFRIRVDGVIELNKTLNELSQKYNIKQWRLLNLEIYNKTNGTPCMFEFFNPNGTGDILALQSVMLDEEWVSYTELDYSTLSKSVGRFKDDLISCVMLPPKPGKPEPKCGVMFKNEVAKLESKEKIIK